MRSGVVRFGQEGVVEDVGAFEGEVGHDDEHEGEPCGTRRHESEPRRGRDAQDHVGAEQGALATGAIGDGAHDRRGERDEQHRQGDGHAKGCRRPEVHGAELHAGAGQDLDEVDPAESGEDDGGEGGVREVEHAPGEPLAAARRAPTGIDAVDHGAGRYTRTGPGGWPRWRPRRRAMMGADGTPSSLPHLRCPGRRALRERGVSLLRAALQAARPEQLARRALQRALGTC